MRVDAHLVEHELIGLGPFGVLGHALIAKEIAESVVIPEIPTVYRWPTIANTLPDIQYDPLTGHFTMLRDVFFWSVASWRVFGATSRQVFADAEVSFDGGSTWIRGTDSGREETASTNGRTLQFPFAGHYPAETMLRFVLWSSGNGATIRTASRDGSVFPAARLTTVTIHGTRRA